MPRSENEAQQKKHSNLDRAMAVVEQATSRLHAVVRWAGRKYDQFEERADRIESTVSRKAGKFVDDMLDGIVEDLTGERLPPKNSNTGIDMSRAKREHYANFRNF